MKKENIFSIILFRSDAEKKKEKGYSSKNLWAWKREKYYTRVTFQFSKKKRKRKLVYMIILSLFSSFHNYKPKSKMQRRTK